MEGFANSGIVARVAHANVESSTPKGIVTSGQLVSQQIDG